MKGATMTMWLSIAYCCGLLRISSAFVQRSVCVVGLPRTLGVAAPSPHVPGDSVGRWRSASALRRSRSTRLRDMKRPILDRLASFVFRLENDRVASSSVVDEKGRSGEPMEWAEEGSFANRFSAAVASNDVGYRFKQAVADLVAGDYDQEARESSIQNFVGGTPVAMYSFTTCPYCRKAKDILDERSIPYESVELDLLPSNEGKEIRAELGRLTKRTSIPSIFIGGEK
ncbi:hypothetical protein ACHAWF_005241 [Thalassiosira exigua]